MTNSSEHIFALIIGINQYQYTDDLRGAVNDANAIENFLIGRLRVPPRNIKVLRDVEATRKNIIDTFQDHLTDNDAIGQGDTIIFFFAGHGGRTDAPHEWKTKDGQVEVICPHDTAEPIPDRTVNGLLRTLAGKKGNNITAIFDCCYSAGVTRSPQGELRPRYVPNLCPITDPNLDKHIWDKSARPGAADIPVGFIYSCMSSHVLLAACSEEQNAWENATHGLFTEALTESLSELESSYTTYEDLISSLKPRVEKWQVPQCPQCEGERKNHVVFNTEVMPAKDYQFSFPLKRKDGGAFEVGAGRIHGVVEKTEFSVRAPPSSGSAELHFDWQHLGIFVAREVRANSSELHLKQGGQLKIPQNARAFISNWKNECAKLKVSFTGGRSDTLMKSLEGGTPEEKSRRLFIYDDVPEKADVVLRYQPSELVIERLDRVIGKMVKGVLNFPFSITAMSSIPFILDEIALFRYHLLRHHGVTNVFHDVHQALQSKSEMESTLNVKMRIYRLNRDGFGERTPDNKVGDLLKDNQAQVTIGEERYGIEVLNCGKHNNLFAYLFYFDTSDFSIQDWYLPRARDTKPPLCRTEAGPGKITIGYDAGGFGGGDPIEFSLPAGEQRHTDFIKLFVSNEYVDMSHITQKGISLAMKRPAALRPEKGFPMWCTSLAAITINRSH